MTVARPNVGRVFKLYKAVWQGDDILVGSGEFIRCPNIWKLKQEDKSNRAVFKAWESDNCGRVFGYKTNHWQCPGYVTREEAISTFLRDQSKILVDLESRVVSLRRAIQTAEADK